MPTLLHLDSSADLLTSTSRALTARFAQRWAALGEGRDVVHRDLHVDQLPHLPTNALHWAARLRAPGETAAPEAEALQQELIDEVLAADVVLVGAPMYNWSVPSTLKAWIDYIHVAGVTASFDETTQPFAGKPLVLVTSRGDQYGPGTPNVEHQLPGLRQLFAGSLGMEVHEVIAELTLAPRIPAMKEVLEKSQASLAAAHATIDDLVHSLA